MTTNDIELIQRPLPACADAAASYAREALASLEGEYRRAAEPYLRVLSKCEEHRPPPMIVLHREAAAKVRAQQEQGR